MEFANAKNITIIFHKNLNSSFEAERNSPGHGASILQDEKHLAQRAAAMFAGNIKFALRKTNMLPSKTSSQKNTAESTRNTSITHHEEPAYTHPLPKEDETNSMDRVSRKSLFCEAMLKVFDRFL